MAKSKKQVYRVTYKHNWSERQETTVISATSQKQAEESAQTRLAQNNKNSKIEVLKVEPTKTYFVEDICEKFPHANYMVNIDIDGLQGMLDRYKEHYNLDMNPDFQRGHVWTSEQQVAFVEYFLRGGRSGRDIYFNAPGWSGRGDIGDMVLVDGLQRLTALLKFAANDMTVFGEYKYEDLFNPRMDAMLNIHVNNLATRKEVLKWYLAFNSAGTIHSKEELARVRKLMEAE